MVLNVCIVHTTSVPYFLFPAAMLTLSKKKLLCFEVYPMALWEGAPWSWEMIEGMSFVNTAAQGEGEETEEGGCGKVFLVHF